MTTICPISFYSLSFSKTLRCLNNRMVEENGEIEEHSKVD